jgi:hypothetical protein
MTTQHNAGRIFQRGCSIHALGIVFLLSMLALLGKLQADYFRDSGIPVEAVVMGIDVVTGKTAYSENSFINETIQFEYPVDGHILRPRQTFFYDTAFFIGQKVRVHYLADTPWIGKIQVNAIDNPYVPLIIGLGLFLMLVIALYVGVGLNPREKQKRKEKPAA